MTAVPIPASLRNVRGLHFDEDILGPNYGRCFKAPHNKGQVWRRIAKAKPQKAKKGGK